MAGTPAGKPRALWAPLFFATLFFLWSSVDNRLLAAERAPVPVSFQAGVLELAGSAGISLNYENESGGRRESTQLRVTPSIGYFLLPGFEILLNASYILSIVRDQDAGFRDHTDAFLFTLGPAYNVYQLSDRLVPYAGLLLGMYYRNISNRGQNAVPSRSDLLLALGLDAGIRWMLTENLSLRTGLQYIHGFRDSEVGSTNYLGLTLGVSVFIPTWPSHAGPRPPSP